MCRFKYIVVGGQQLYLCTLIAFVFICAPYLALNLNFKLLLYICLSATCYMLFKICFILSRGEFILSSQLFPKYLLNFRQKDLFQNFFIPLFGKLFRRVPLHNTSHSKGFSSNRHWH